MSEIYTRDGWRVQRDGNIYEFSRRFTLSGAAENFDLSIPFPFQLNRVQYFSDDATAKSFTERIFSAGAVDPNQYDQIVNVAVDTNQSVAYMGDISDKWLMQPIVMRTAVSASTGGKFLTKTVNVTRLDTQADGLRRSAGEAAWGQ